MAVFRPRIEFMRQAERPALFKRAGAAAQPCGGGSWRGRHAPRLFSAARKKRVFGAPAAKLRQTRDSLGVRGVAPIRFPGERRPRPCPGQEANSTRRLPAPAPALRQGTCGTAAGAQSPFGGVADYPAAGGASMRHPPECVACLRILGGGGIRPSLRGGLALFLRDRSAPVRPPCREKRGFDAPAALRKAPASSKASRNARFPAGGGGCLRPDVMRGGRFSPFCTCFPAGNSDACLRETAFFSFPTARLSACLFRRSAAAQKEPLCSSRRVLRVFPARGPFQPKQ